MNEKIEIVQITLRTWNGFAIESIELAGNAIHIGQSSGDVTVRVIDDTTINVVSGQQRLYFDFDVPIGTDFELGVSASNSGLYRNNAGPDYPYVIGSAMTITSSSANSSPTGYYYFYYDIEVEALCVSNTVFGCIDSMACNYNINANTVS